MRKVLALVVALLAVGCGSSSTAPTPPTLPTPTIDCTLVGTLPCQIPPPPPPPAPAPPPAGPSVTIVSLDIPAVRFGLPSVMTVTATGDARGFAWSFGDGTSTTAVEHVSHVYAAPGSYVVTVVASNKSSEATATGTATVLAIPPPLPPAPALFVTLTCIVNAHAVASPCNVSVTDQTGASVTASITNVVYDWGDGQVDTVIGSPLASHTYAQPGVYTIRATVTANGITGSTTKIATVS